MAKAKRPLVDRFTSSLKSAGRIWVPLDEVEALLPDPERTGWVSDETVELLNSATDQGVSGIVILWSREHNEIQTISTVEDADEIADALEHCRRKYRNPAWVKQRRMAELKVRH
jgi:hypothetical protein